MAGSTWNTFIASTKVKGSQMNQNFDWLEGHIVPMIAGSTTSGVYDLGTTTARWNNLYLSGNFDINSVSVNKISTDGTFSDNSDSFLSTQKATKTYINASFVHTTTAVAITTGAGTLTATVTLSTSANVLIFAHADLQAFGTWVNPIASIESGCHITRDTSTTGITGASSRVYNRMSDIWSSNVANIVNIHSHSIVAYDSPGAGTHTYQLRSVLSSGTSISYSLVVHKIS